MTPPDDALAATTHPDPYPFYAELAARAPFAFDARLGLWIAAGSDAVTAVLASELCRVRPVDEPVPRALAGSRLGELYARLARMNDAPAHEPLRRVATAAVAALDAPGFAERAARTAHALWTSAAGAPLGARVDRLATRLAPTSLAARLGVPREHLGALADDTRAVARAIAPACSAAELEAGIAATDRLCERLGAGPDLDAAAANRVGLLLQSHDATAGWLGNSLLALARDPAERARACADRSALERIVHDTLRRDPPVHSTRRFVARDGVIAGQPVRAGQIILVLLVAAGFGAGRHACPGHALAASIVCAGVATVLRASPALDGLPVRPRYRPSANTRVPIFQPA